MWINQTLDTIDGGNDGWSSSYNRRHLPTGVATHEVAGRRCPDSVKEVCCACTPPATALEVCWSIYFKWSEGVGLSCYIRFANGIVATPQLYVTHHDTHGHVQCYRECVPFRTYHHSPVLLRLCPPMKWNLYAPMGETDSAVHPLTWNTETFVVPPIPPAPWLRHPTQQQHPHPVVRLMPRHLQQRRHLHPLARDCYRDTHNKDVTAHTRTATRERPDPTLATPSQILSLGWLTDGSRRKHKHEYNRARVTVVKELRRRRRRS